MQVSTQTLPLHRTSSIKKITKAGIVLFLLLILFYPSASYQGAKKGLLLWFNTLVPTLLPFMIISNLIIRLQITKPLSNFFYPLFHRIFGVSKGGCYPVLMGFFAGLPVGAKSVADLVDNKTITIREGQYILGFCNNASPMFIMGYIAIAQLNLPTIRFGLLILNFASAVLATYIYFHLPRSRKISQLLSTQECDNGTYDYRESSKFDFAKLDFSIMDSFEVITKVGGYIILFSIAAQIISDLGSQDSYLKLLAISLLEITTGINRISHSSLDLSTKIAFITMITAFGGLSGLAQTKSVINNTRLSIGIYLHIKIIHMFIALAMTLIYIKILGI